MGGFVQEERGGSASQNVGEWGAGRGDAEAAEGVATPLATSGASGERLETPPGRPAERGQASQDGPEKPRPLSGPEPQELGGRKGKAPPGASGGSARSELLRGRTRGLPALWGAGGGKKGGPPQSALQDVWGPPPGHIVRARRGRAGLRSRPRPRPAPPAPRTPTPGTHPGSPAARSRRWQRAGGQRGGRRRRLRPTPP